jgi:Tfp pilus assembly protein PilX
MMQRLHRDQRGVAALTIMLVTAVLGISGAVVVFTATTELEVGGRDRQAESAFAASEAGLDLAAGHLFRSPTFVSGQTQHCLDNPLVPASAGIACEVRLTSPTNGQLTYPATGRPYVEYTVVSRSREGREVVRTLAATYRLNVLDIPYGMYIDGNVNLNGNPRLFRESLLVNGTITDREKLNTDANGNGQFDDPDLGWRFHGAMVSANPAPDMCTHPEGGQVACVGAFSNFQIYSKNSVRNSDEIHFASSNPAASAFPRDRDVHQTVFDGSGTPIPVVTVPVDPILEIMEPLKDAARQQGLYFNIKNGVSETLNYQPSNLNAATRNFEKNVSIYFDADASDIIKWKVNLIPDSTSSDIRYLRSDGQRVGSLSGVFVVRGGQLHLESGTQWSGALFVPENELRLLGGNTCTCTMYTKGFSAQGGGSTIQLTSDWFRNLPAGFVAVTRQGFFECEPYQASNVCPTA